MKRADFILYDVIDTDGPCKGLHNNHTPLDLENAQKLARLQPSGKPEIVPTENKKWEDYVFEQRHGRRAKAGAK